MTPRGDISNVTCGIDAIAVVNCAPLNEACSTGTWNGSTTFSKCCSQLHGNDRRPAAAERGIVCFDELALVHHFETFVARQHRLALGRPHIGEDQPVALLDRIPGLAHLLAKQAAVRLAGLLKAMALRVEQPAVIAAADAALLDLAVIERRAAMAAARVDEPRSPGAIAKQDQVLAQRPDLLRCAGRVGREPDGMPVAPQQLAHRRAAADKHQIGFGCRRLELVGRALVATGCAAQLHGDPPRLCNRVRVSRGGRKTAQHRR